MYSTFMPLIVCINVHKQFHNVYNVYNSQIILAQIFVKLVHFETFSKDVFNELQIVLKFEPLKNLVTHIFG